MLKSTHKPEGGQALPEGWTEHKAPTGHSYYYNASTKNSTYTRPTAAPPPAAPLPEPFPTPLNASQSFLQYQSVGHQGPVDGQNFDAFASQGQFNDLRGRGEHRGGRGGHEQRAHRPQPTDKPVSKQPIPDQPPWLLVHTKLGRRFAYNSDKNQSYWRIPDKLKPGILELDQLRIKEKAEAAARPKNEDEPVPDQEETDEVVERIGSGVDNAGNVEGEDSSEYEEVEVTDDEDNEGEGSSAKRQKLEEEEEEPVEFNEDDIAWQLAAMGEEHGLDPGEYDDGHMEEWEEGVEGIELTYEDSKTLFKDLLSDFGINPYSPWEKLVEEGKLVDDTRYTALNSMKARREVWEEWSREKIKVLRDQRAKEERKDPRIPFLAFLQKNATPKLYWPEFKRKFRKEPELRDSALPEKDREKFYREHINRLKLPQSTLKTDFLNLLKAQPLSTLNNSTLSSHLPAEIVANIKYISLDPTIRDPLVESYITTLQPPPEVSGVEGEASEKEKTERLRRQKALEDRQRQVADEKMRQRRSLAIGREKLREEEADIERAMNISKKGLLGHMVVEEEKGETEQDNV